MTLAEAIVLAALEGGSMAGLDTLMDSINAILLGLTAPLGASTQPKRSRYSRL
jgi:hypothetical protein